MATVFYCLALLKCSFSYSLFDRFRAENWWFREKLSSVHTHTQTNTMAGMERIDISDLKGLQYLGLTYFISSNHLLPCYLMLLTLLPGWLLILSGSEQCVVWQIYCEFLSRRHIPQKTKVYVRGCIKDGDLFTRYSDVCWLILKDTRFFRRFWVSWWAIPACSFLGNKNKPWLVDENTSALSKRILCVFLGIWFSRLRDFSSDQR